MTMDEREHFARLNRYYNFSRWKYNWFLNGSRHFGFYPERKWIPTQKAQALMQDLVAKKVDASSGKRLLGAGCGQGVTAIYLAKKYACFIDGITVVPYEVEEATKSAEKLNVTSRVKIGLMDYSRLKFPDNYFDGIYSQESLVHSTDIEKTVKELHRVLKPDGKVAFFEYSMADDAKFSKEGLKTINEMNYASAMHSLTRMRHELFERFMQNAGFRNIRVQNISEEVAPMIKHYEIFTKPLYYFLVLFGLTHKTPNLVAAALMVKFGKKDLVRYNIFTACK